MKDNLVMWGLGLTLWLVVNLFGAYAHATPCHYYGHERICEGR